MSIWDRSISGFWFAGNVRIGHPSAPYRANEASLIEAPQHGIGLCTGFGQMLASFPWNSGVE